MIRRAAVAGHDARTTADPDPARADSSETAGLDTRTAHIARIYNYWLGGK
jgi:hypothetical protein